MEIDINAPIEDVGFRDVNATVYLWAIGRLSVEGRVTTLLFGQFYKGLYPPIDNWIYVGRNFKIIRSDGSLKEDEGQEESLKLENTDDGPINFSKDPIDALAKFEASKCLNENEMTQAKSDSISVNFYSYVGQVPTSDDDEDIDSVNLENESVSMSSEIVENEVMEDNRIYRTSGCVFSEVNGRYLPAGEFAGTVKYKNPFGWVLFRTELQEIPELGIYAEGCYDATKGDSLTKLVDRRSVAALKDLLDHSLEDVVKDGSVLFKRRFLEISRAGFRTINTDLVYVKIRTDTLRAALRSQFDTAILLVLDGLAKHEADDMKSVGSKEVEEVRKSLLAKLEAETVDSESKVDAVENKIDTQLEVGVTFARNLTFQSGSQGFPLGSDVLTKPDKAELFPSTLKAGVVDSKVSTVKYFDEEGEATREIIQRIEHREDILKMMQIIASKANKIYLDYGIPGGCNYDEDMDVEWSKLDKLLWDGSRNMSKAEAEVFRELCDQIDQYREATIDVIESIGAWSRILRRQRDKDLNTVPLADSRNEITQITTVNGTKVNRVKHLKLDTRPYCVVIATKGERLYDASKPIVSGIPRFNRGKEEEKFSTIVKNIGVYTTIDEAKLAYEHACMLVSQENRICLYSDSPPMHIGLRNCCKHYIVHTEGVPLDTPCEECARKEYKKGKLIIPPIANQVKSLEIVKKAARGKLRTFESATNIDKRVPLPQFIWHDHNYMEKIWKDANFLSDNEFIKKFMAENVIYKSNPLVMNNFELCKGLKSIRNIVCSKDIDNANPLNFLVGKMEQIIEAKRMGTKLIKKLNGYEHIGKPYANKQIYKVEELMPKKNLKEAKLWTLMDGVDDDVGSFNALSTLLLPPVGGEQGIKKNSQRLFRAFFLLGQSATFENNKLPKAVADDFLALNSTVPATETKLLRSKTAGGLLPSLTGDENNISDRMVSSSQAPRETELIQRENDVKNGKLVEIITNYNVHGANIEVRQLREPLANRSEDVWCRSDVGEWKGLMSRGKNVRSFEFRAALIEEGQKKDKERKAVQLELREAMSKPTIVELNVKHIKNLIARAKELKGSVLALDIIQAEQILENRKVGIRAICRIQAWRRGIVGRRIAKKVKRARRIKRYRYKLTEEFSTDLAVKLIPEILEKCVRTIVKRTIKPVLNVPATMSGVRMVVTVFVEPQGLCRASNEGCLSCQMTKIRDRFVPKQHLSVRERTICTCQYVRNCETWLLRCYEPLTCKVEYLRIPTYMLGELLLTGFKLSQIDVKEHLKRFVVIRGDNFDKEGLKNFNLICNSFGFQCGLVENKLVFQERTDLRSLFFGKLQAARESNILPLLHKQLYSDNMKRLLCNYSDGFELSYKLCNHNKNKLCGEFIWGKKSINSFLGSSVIPRESKLIEDTTEKIFFPKELTRIKLPFDSLVTLFEKVDCRPFNLTDSPKPVFSFSPPGTFLSKSSFLWEPFNDLEVAWRHLQYLKRRECILKSSISKANSLLNLAMDSFNSFDLIDLERAYMEEEDCRAMYYRSFEVYADASAFIARTLKFSKDTINDIEAQEQMLKEDFTNSLDKFEDGNGWEVLNQKRKLIAFVDKHFAEWEVAINKIKRLEGILLAASSGVACAENECAKAWSLWSSNHPYYDVQFEKYQSMIQVTKEAVRNLLKLYVYPLKSNNSPSERRMQRIDPVSSYVRHPLVRAHAENRGLWSRIGWKVKPLKRNISYDMVVSGKKGERCTVEILFDVVTDYVIILLNDSTLSFEECTLHEDFYLNKTSLSLLTNDVEHNALLIDRKIVDNVLSKCPNWPNCIRNSDVDEAQFDCGCKVSQQDSSSKSIVAEDYLWSSVMSAMRMRKLPRTVDLQECKILLWEDGRKGNLNTQTYLKQNEQAINVPRKNLLRLFEYIKLHPFSNRPCLGLVHFSMRQKYAWDKILNSIWLKDVENCRPRLWGNGVLRLSRSSILAVGPISDRLVHRYTKPLSFLDNPDEEMQRKRNEYSVKRYRNLESMQSKIFCYISNVPVEVEMRHVEGILDLRVYLCNMESYALLSPLRANFQPRFPTVLQGSIPILAIMQTMAATRQHSLLLASFLYEIVTNKFSTDSIYFILDRLDFFLPGYGATDRWWRSPFSGTSELKSENQKLLKSPPNLVSTKLEDFTVANRDSLHLLYNPPLNVELSNREVPELSFLLGSPRFRFRGPIYTFCRFLCGSYVRIRCYVATNGDFAICIDTPNDGNFSRHLYEGNPLSITLSKSEVRALLLSSGRNYAKYYKNVNSDYAGGPLFFIDRMFDLLREENYYILFQYLVSCVVIHKRQLVLKDSALKLIKVETTGQTEENNEDKEQAKDSPGKSTNYEALSKMLSASSLVVRRKTKTTRSKAAVKSLTEVNENVLDKSTGKPGAFIPNSPVRKAEVQSLKSNARHKTTIKRTTVVSNKGNEKAKRGPEVDSRNSGVIASPTARKSNAELKVKRSTVIPKKEPTLGKSKVRLRTSSQSPSVESSVELATEGFVSPSRRESISDCDSSVVSNSSLNSPESSAVAEDSSEHESDYEAENFLDQTVEREETYELKRRFKVTVDQYLAWHRRTCKKYFLGNAKSKISYIGGERNFKDNSSLEEGFLKGFVCETSELSKYDATLCKGIITGQASRDVDSLIKDDSNDGFSGPYAWNDCVWEDEFGEVKDTRLLTLQKVEYNKRTQYIVSDRVRDRSLIDNVFYGDHAFHKLPTRNPVKPIEFIWHLTQFLPKFAYEIDHADAALSRVDSTAISAAEVSSKDNSLDRLVEVCRGPWSCSDLNKTCLIVTRNEVETNLRSRMLTKVLPLDSFSFGIQNFYHLKVLTNKFCSSYILKFEVAEVGLPKIQEYLVDHESRNMEMEDQYSQLCNASYRCLNLEKLLSLTENSLSQKLDKLGVCYTRLKAKIKTFDESTAKMKDFVGKKKIAGFPADDWCKSKYFQLVEYLSAKGSDAMQCLIGEDEIGVIEWQSLVCIANHDYDESFNRRVKQKLSSAFLTLEKYRRAVHNSSHLTWRYCNTNTDSVDNSSVVSRSGGNMYDQSGRLFSVNSTSFRNPLVWQRVRFDRVRGRTESKYNFPLVAERMINPSSNILCSPKQLSLPIMGDIALKPSMKEGLVFSKPNIGPFDLFSFSVYSPSTSKNVRVLVIPKGYSPETYCAKRVVESVFAVAFDTAIVQIFANKEKTKVLVDGYKLSDLNMVRAECLDNLAKSDIINRELSRIKLYQYNMKKFDNFVLESRLFCEDVKKNVPFITLTEEALNFRHVGKLFKAEVNAKKKNRLAFASSSTVSEIPLSVSEIFTGLQDNFNYTKYITKCLRLCREQVLKFDAKYVVALESGGNLEGFVTRSPVLSAIYFPNDPMEQCIPIVCYSEHWEAICKLLYLQKSFSESVTVQRLLTLSGYLYCLTNCEHIRTEVKSLKQNFSREFHKLFNSNSRNSRLERFLVESEMLCSWRTTDISRNNLISSYRRILSSLTYASTITGVNLESQSFQDNLYFLESGTKVGLYGDMIVMMRCANDFSSSISWCDKCYKDSLPDIKFRQQRELEARSWMISSHERFVGRVRDVARLFLPSFEKHFNWSLRVKENNYSGEDITSFCIATDTEIQVLLSKYTAILSLGNNINEERVYHDEMQFHGLCLLDTAVAIATDEKLRRYDYGHILESFDSLRSSTNKYFTPVTRKIIDLSTAYESKHGKSLVTHSLLQAVCDKFRIVYSNGIDDQFGMESTDSNSVIFPEKFIVSTNSKPIGPWFFQPTVGQVMYSIYQLHCSCCILPHSVCRIPGCGEIRSHCGLYPGEVVDLGVVSNGNTSIEMAIKRFLMKRNNGYISKIVPWKGHLDGYFGKDPKVVLREEDEALFSLQDSMTVEGIMSMKYREINLISKMYRYVHRRLLRPPIRPITNVSTIIECTDHQFVPGSQYFWKDPLLKQCSIDVEERKPEHSLDEDWEVEGLIARYLHFATDARAARRKGLNPDINSEGEIFKALRSILKIIPTKIGGISESEKLQWLLSSASSNNPAVTTCDIPRPVVKFSNEEKFLLNIPSDFIKDFLGGVGIDGQGEKVVPGIWALTPYPRLRNDVVRNSNSMPMHQNLFKWLVGKLSHTVSRVTADSNDCEQSIITFDRMHCEQVILLQEYPVIVQVLHGISESNFADSVESACSRGADRYFPVSALTELRPGLTIAVYDVASKAHLCSTVEGRFLERLATAIIELRSSSPYEGQTLDSLNTNYPLLARLFFTIAKDSLRIDRTGIICTSVNVDLNRIQSMITANRPLNVFVSNDKRITGGRDLPIQQEASRKGRNQRFNRVNFSFENY